MLSRVFIFLIQGLRPLLGPVTCKFHETCMPYAIRQLKKKSFPRALLSICRRLLSCSPFSKNL